MAKQPKSYQEAYDELQQLAERLENNEVGIDDLSAAVKRARELVKFCQEKLRKTESSLEDTEE